MQSFLHPLISAHERVIALRNAPSSLRRQAHRDLIAATHRVKVHVYENPFDPSNEIELWNQSVHDLQAQSDGSEQYIQTISDANDLRNRVVACIAR